MKTAEEFIKELQGNQAKIDELKQLSSNDEVKAFIQKEGISCTVDELGEAVRQYLKNDNELSDNDLSGVSGGGNGDMVFEDYGGCAKREDVVYKFHLGDRVEVRYWLNFSRRGTIKRRIVKKHFYLDNVDYRPYYDVQLDCGTFLEEVAQDDIAY